MNTVMKLRITQKRGFLLGLFDFEERADTETSVIIKLEYRTAKISREFPYEPYNYKLLKCLSITVEGNVPIGPLQKDGLQNRYKVPRNNDTFPVCYIP